MALLTDSSAWREEAKRLAASRAVDELVRDGMVLGLGSGSTVAYAVRRLSERAREEGLELLCVPTSYQIAFLAVEAGLRLTSLDEHPEPDLAIDGADQVSQGLDLIKGGGAALTREKIVDSAAKKLAIIVDEAKLADRLGEKGFPIPIEVLPFARTPVIRALRGMGAKEARVRESGPGKVGPVITDNGNLIIDAYFGPINEPDELDKAIRAIPGVVETGLFLGMTDLLYVGTRSGAVRVLKRGA